jgi:hypothetical protein
MVDVQNASIAGGVAVGTTANMMLGPVGAQVIGFLAGSLSVSGYVFIQPFLETRFGIFDACGVQTYTVCLESLLESLESFSLEWCPTTDTTRIELPCCVSIR